MDELMSVNEINRTILVSETQGVTESITGSVFWVQRLSK